MGWSRLWRRTRREIDRYRRAVPKLGRLDAVDYRNLVRAQAALIKAQRAVGSMPRGDLVRDDEPSGGLAADSPHVQPNRVDDARRIALAVNRVAAFGMFRPKCLVRAMALRRLLDADGISGAQVRVGVQIRQGGFAAHAWVEYAGQVVGDDPDVVGRYSTLPGLTVADLG
jgi:hypothetical protein